MPNIGPKLQVDGEREYRAALNNIIEQAKALDAEMKAVTSSFDKNTSAQEKAQKQSATLNSQVEVQRERVKMLTDMLNKSAEKYGDNDTKTLKWAQAVSEATADLNKLENELKESNDKLADWGSLADKAASIAPKFGSALAVSTKALGVFTLEAGKAAFTLGKSVVESFGELEQNLGGAEAVFGEHAKNLERISEEAYLKMGTSQSQYLATANKMGALFQGSGVEQQRSLELTTQAMQRATDMASVMGIDTQSALDAVTGAAKGNYTMMDNLGVAMNATTLKAYAAAQGFETAFDKMSNAEKAEVAMQYFFQQTEQYAGNFEREATQTITGSIGLLQASLQSFVAGLGNSEADITKLAENIVTAFEAVVENVTPIAENIIAVMPDAINSMMEAAKDLLPELLELVADLFNSALEALIDMLPELIPVAVDMIMKVVDTLINNLDKIIAAAIQLIVTLATALVTNIPKLVAKIPEIINAVVKAFTSFNWGSIGKNIIDGIKNGITSMASSLLDTARNICSNLVSTITSKLKIHSPSRLFRDEVGKMIPAGIAVGIEAGTPDMLKEAQASVGALADVAGAQNYNYGGVAINVYAQEGQSTSDIADMVMEAMQNAVSRKEAVFA